MKIKFKKRNIFKNSKVLIKVKKILRPLVKVAKKVKKAFDRKMFRIRRETRFGKYLPSQKAMLYTLAGVMFFTSTVSFIPITPIEKIYAIDENVEELIGPSVDKFSDVLEYSRENDAYEYNEHYTPSLNVGGSTARPQFLATLNKDIQERGVEVYDPVNQVSVRLLSTDDSGNPGKNGNRVVYPLKDYDALRIFSMNAASIKEDLILNSYIADELSFDYKLEMSPGLEARIESDGSIGIYGVRAALLGDIQTGTDEDAELLNKAREVNNKNRLIFRIPAPFIVESDINSSETLTWYTLNDNTLTLHAANLGTANYPLSIDPSIYVETAARLMRGNNETNTDFDVSNELIQKSQTTGARIDAWNTNLDMSEAIWGHQTVAAGGYIYRSGGRTGTVATVKPSIAESTDSFQNSNSSNFTMNMPTNRPADDLYVAVMCHDGTSSVTAPSGGNWTQYYNTREHAAYYKIGEDISGGDEASSYTWTMGGSEKWAGTIMRVTGFDSADIESGSPGGKSESGFNATPEFPSVTPDDDNTLIIRTVGADNDEPSTAGWVPSDHTKISSGGSTGTGDCAWVSASMDNPPAATVATGETGLADTSIADSYGASSLAIKPEPAVGGTTETKTTVDWAQFNSSTLQIESPNPGTGACSGWCAETAYELPDERHGHAMVAYNGYLYVMGGENDSNTRQSTVYIAKLGANGEPQLWHPTDTDKSNWDYWYADTGLSSGTAKSYFSAVAYNNRMYVLGGQTNASPGGITTVEEADILPNGRLGSWTTTGMNVLPSGAGTHMGGAHVYNGVLYTLGGFEGAETSSSNLRSSVYYSKLNNDGSMNDWQTTDSFTTARANYGGAYSYIWGAYLYMGGGCSAVNGSGYCTTFESDMQLASINADGSLDQWSDLGSLDNTRIGYSLLGWQGGLYRIGGCNAVDTGDGECDGTLADVDYGTVNPAGEVSTVNISVPESTSPCSGGSPHSCDLPDTGEGSDESGQLLAPSTILNGYLYVIGGCVDYNCNGTSPSSTNASPNTAYVAIDSNGQLTAPSTCSGTSHGAWCIDSTNLINDTGNATTDGVAAAGITTFGNRIYVIGGRNGEGVLDSIWHNAVNNDGSLDGAWESDDMGTAGISEDISYTWAFTRADPSAAGSSPGNMFIFGGCGNDDQNLTCGSAAANYETEVYKCDISTTGGVSGCTTSGQLQIDSDPDTGGSQGLGIHAGAVNANYVYLIGGYSDTEADKDEVMYAQIDDNNDIVAVSGGIWQESANTLNVGRRRGAAFGYNGHIYAVGGYDADEGVLPFIEWSKMDVSDGDINEFVTSSVVINQRWGLSVVVSNSYAYVIGGCDNGASPDSCSSFEPSVQTFQLYNNDSGSVDDFTAQTDQTFAADTDRWGASAAIMDGYIYVAGGCTSATDCTTVTDDVQYAPISADDGSIGTWSSLATLPAARAWGYLGVAGGDLYYVGGEDGAGDEKSDVYYITPNPGGAGLGTIEHYSARRTTEQTKSADGWDSVSGTADTGTTASTNGFVDSTNLTAGQEYLIMVWASHNDSNGNTQSGVRVTHGGTAFTESQAIEDVDRTNASYKTPYFWFDVWTAVSNEDLEVEYYRNGSGTARVEDVTMLVINAEELESDGDLQYDIDTGGGSLSDTFTANSSITWTPANANDSWWIMGYVQGDTGASIGDQLEYQFNIDSGTIRSSTSIEGEVSTDTPLYGIGWVEPFSAASHTVDLEIRENNDNDHWEWDASGIMALNLDRFEDFAEYSEAGDGTDITAVNTWVEQGSVNPTVSTQGDFIIAAGGISDDDNRRMQHRLQMPDATSITDAVGGWQQNSNDLVPYTIADMQIDLTTGAKDIDYDAQYTNGTTQTANVEDRWVVFLSMEQGGTNSWSTASNGLPGDRTRFGAAVWNNRIYVVGGLDDSAADTTTVYYSPQLNSGGDITSAWSTSTSFDTARSGAAVTAYANNLYLFGGYDGSNYLSDVQYTQINTDGTVDAWENTISLPGPISDARAFSANGYMYLVGGRSAASTCVPNTLISPIVANTTIATGNNPTGIGDWYETNVRYTGDRYGAAVAYDEGKFYTMGGGCSSPLSSNRHYESSVNSQPQVAQYSRLIDTDTDVFPNSWLLNGLDNSIGARWEVRYRSMHDLDGVVNPTEDCGSSETMPAMTTFGQETDYGEVTLGDVAGYTALNSSGEDINCARYFYFFIEIDASQTFGYPEDVNRGPTIDDLSLFFTSDPSKRLRHGKTFTGGEKQPLDTPCGQSVDPDCPNP